VQLELIEEGPLEDHLFVNGGVTLVPTAYPVELAIEALVTLCAESDSLCADFDNHLMPSLVLYNCAALQPPSTDATDEGVSVVVQPT
jgi:hypothetical protein